MYYYHRFAVASGFVLVEENSGSLCNRIYLCSINLLRFEVRTGPCIQYKELLWGNETLQQKKNYRRFSYGVKYFWKIVFTYSILPWKQCLHSLHMVWMEHRVSWNSISIWCLLCHFQEFDHMLISYGQF